MADYTCDTTPSGDPCANSTTQCVAKNTTINPGNAANPAAVSAQQSYGGSDVSWPNLLPIHVTDDYDPTKSTNLFLIFPGSYMDGSTYRFSRQGMDDSFKQSTACNNYNLNQTSLGRYSDHKINRTIMTKSIDVTIKYLAVFPNIDAQTNPRVVANNDTTFGLESNSPSLFQFYFSASVPGQAYAPLLTKQVAGGTCDTTCAAQAIVDQCTCQDITSMPTSQTVVQTITPPSTPAFTQDGIFVTNQGFQNKHAGLSTTITLNSTTCGNMKLKFGSAAHMRDGFKRVIASTQQTYCGDQTGGTVLYGYELDWDTTIKADDVHGLAYPSGNQTCSSEHANANAHILLDSDGKTNRSVFLTLTLPSTIPPNIHFAETQDNLLKSFNVRGRFPGCLTSTEASVTTTSPQFATQASDYLKVGATLAAQIQDFTFDIPVNLQGQGSQGKVGQTYKPSDGQIWNSTALPNWPSLTKDDLAKTKIPDITVRIIFYNSAIYDPVQGTDKQLTAAILQNVHQTLSTVYTQNSPLAIKSCQDLYVHAFERGVAFVEFFTKIAYSLLYNFNIESTLQSLYFRVQYNVYMQSDTYTNVDFASHLIKRLALPTNNKPPTLFLDPSQESQMSVDDELAAWANEMLVQTSKYFLYPQFRQDGADIWVSFQVHPMMHAHLQTYAADMQTNMQTYLNNFFQDFTSNLDNLILGTSNAYGVVGQIQVQKGDGFYDGTTNLPLTLASGAQQPKNNMTLAYAPTNQSYTLSYAYEGKVDVLSVGAFLYILQHNKTFQIDFSNTQTSAYHYIGENPILPMPVASLDQATLACLTSATITSDCQSKLCAQASACLCDFSTLIGTQDEHIVNPTPLLYMNNSNGNCTCLASDSYPRSSQIQRALNPVSRCFAKACQGKIKETDPLFCAYVACSTLTQAMHSDKKGASNWFDLFPDKGQGLDLTKLNETCDLKLVHQGDLQIFKIEVNWYLIMGTICLALAAPLALALDYFGMNQRRSRKQYFIWLGIIIVMLGLAGLFFYALNGEYKCKQIDMANTKSAQCVDRLTHLIPLSKEACDPHLPLFCQCDQSGTTCFDYIPGAKYKSTCTTQGICTVCPNATTKVDLTTSKVVRTSVPTTWVYLATSAGLLVIGLVCITLASYFKNLGYAMKQRAGILIGIGFLIAFLTFGALIAGMNHTKAQVESIDQAAQAQQAKAKKDPCD